MAIEMESDAFKKCWANGNYHKKLDLMSGVIFGIGRGVTSQTI